MKARQHFSLLSFATAIFATGRAMQHDAGHNQSNLAHPSIPHDMQPFPVPLKTESETSQTNRAQGYPNHRTLFKGQLLTTPPHHSSFESSDNWQWPSTSSSTWVSGPKTPVPATPPAFDSHVHSQVRHMPQPLLASGSELPSQHYLSQGSLMLTPQKLKHPTHSLAQPSHNDVPLPSRLSRNLESEGRDNQETPLGSMVSNVMAQYAYLWDMPQGSEQQSPARLESSAHNLPEEHLPAPLPNSYHAMEHGHFPGTDPNQYRSTQWLHSTKPNDYSHGQGGYDYSADIPEGYARSIYGARTERLQKRYNVMRELLDPDSDWDSATLSKILASLLDTVRSAEEGSEKTTGTFL